MVRHNLTFKAVQDVIRAFNIVTNTQNPVADSYYLTKKAFSSTHTEFVRHFYCAKCEVELGISDQCYMHCQNCNKRRKSYFIVFDLKTLITRVVDANFEAIIEYQQYVNDQATICDIGKGNYLQSFGNHRFLSFNYNFDGIAQYKSIQKSLWPIQLVINDLPPRIRMAKKNCIVSSFWLDKCQPIMKLFLRPFVDQIKTLSNDGITIRDINFKILPAAMCVDNPARSKGLEMMSYNAAFGCTVCMQESTLIDLGNCRQYRYKYQNYIRLRTSQLQKLHAIRATNNNTTVYGVKKLSILFELPFFEPWCGGPDELHCLHIGFCKKFLDLILDSKYRGNGFYIGGRRGILNKLNDLILGIRTYSENKRDIRRISERAQWKASEYFHFLYYHCIILQNFLPDNVMKNFQGFRECFVALSLPNLTTNTINEIDRKIRRLVQEYENIFGIVQMTSNVHQLLHLAHTVKEFGPLWTTSTFNFEGMNGVFRDFTPGTKQPLLQIGLRYQLFHSAQFCITSDNVTEITKDFCKSVISQEHRNQKLSRGDVLARTNAVLTEMNTYNQFIFKGICYCSEKYSQDKMKDDSFISLDGSFFRIQQILENKITKALFFVLKLIAITGKLYNDFFEYNFTEITEIRQITDEKQLMKCISIEFNDSDGNLKQYLVKIQHYLYHD
jgi:hypothetical protein